ncbi:NAD(P)H-dependent glycerol-3-phosphate dehydrogenase [Liquorilactobacillus satsumensis]|uniref:NAD(P)H-dependent glycerol-3-phosphate dehydrogenase n=1 Tax=Liquorilactobacillus satsumensis TaxID=259059 RepID=UPI000704AB0E|nr:NAD(P)H-dependent glycerol-3-phosphate dehydrogenase [Liquorilactobacillus satsumensis]MCC7665758.1 NAD(P)H-dependent glycerol-3-phosphate dehydrogenase [Liquorilactobacillus satsumensis]MCP9313419.1 NAD(P)H-dependent glycerol-3-phosphate dehydrogenase [Liquorilactobacillus satsumensis]MCP9328228.1 NAD(P)H-dependent glycerol-3-phosphate dehydrogenase [Liquorilactobacillus satsumensis]MCP9356447.1 NAD(P)H-dependent glycerol-3-phosphate dehydrogenase [Liquorilactobacillus satsumensis]MCP93605
MCEKIAVIGAGSWGSVLANILILNGKQVCIWSRRQEQVEELNNLHTNEHYLPKLKYDPRLEATTSLARALAGADVILFAIPTKAIRAMAQQVATLLKAGAHPVIVHASKGLELKTHKRISEILAEEIPSENRAGIVALSGPSHAEEVARHDLTLITAAAKDKKAAQCVQKIFMNEYFRVYTNSDIIGVELGAAFKNIIALGAGALHGLGYGDDAKAALMTRGLAEIARLGVALGADPMTFIGLTGVGDLIVTCTSVHSRNWRAGDQLGRGQKLADIVANMGMVIEGINTTKAAYELAQQKQIEMPITEAIYEVLYQGKEIKAAIADLMKREGRSEEETNY